MWITAGIGSSVAVVGVRGVRALLSSAYGELFAVSREWGKAKKDKRLELTNEIDRFIRGLTAALESMEGGLVLRRPNREQLELCRADDTAIGGATLAGGMMSTTYALQRANQSPEVVVGLESLLAEWCEDMEKYVAKNVGACSSSGGGSGNRLAPASSSSSSDDTVDVGPKGELTYWRGRTHG